MANETRRLTVLRTRNEEFPFTITTEYRNTLGYWVALSVTSVKKFPILAVERVSGRNDYKVYVRVMDGIVNS